MADTPIKEEALRLINTVETREGLVRFIYKGQCMFPVLQDEDLILVRPVSAQDLRLGDIVVYTARGHRWVHRFLYRKPIGEKFGMIAKPDNAWVADPPFFKESLVGIVQGARRDKKSVNFSSAGSRLSSRLIGFLSLAEWTLHVIFKRLRELNNGRVRLPGFLKKTICFLAKAPKDIAVRVFPKKPR